ncbi:MAG: protein jag [Spirochaetales bacterium]|nr:MAG: protein jag [Spirochaetales bacterium]
MVEEIFEGKTEKEAIDKAVSKLGIDRDEFDVEIIESQEKGLFRKGKVRIKVQMQDDEEELTGSMEPENDDEKKLMEFLEECIRHMGFPGNVKIQSREEKKLNLEIVSRFSGILIGKKGKNLDALQLVLNVYSGKLGIPRKVFIDAEGYRGRREEALIRLARKTADQVRKNRGSRLLEPMNPFERRLIHTSLNDLEDIDTKSEGEGLYKQVRIMYRGMQR